MRNKHDVFTFFTFLLMLQTMRTIRDSNVKSWDCMSIFYLIVCSQLYDFEFFLFFNGICFCSYHLAYSFYSILLSNGTWVFLRGSFQAIDMHLRLIGGSKLNVSAGACLSPRPVQDQTTDQEMNE